MNNDIAAVFFSVLSLAVLISIGAGVCTLITLMVA